MSIEIILQIVFALTTIGAVVYLIWQQQQKSSGLDEKQVQNIVNQVFGMSAQKIAEQSKQILSSEKETIKTDLDNKQRVIEKLVKQLQDDMKGRQDEIRTLERDRTQKFSELTTAIEQHRLLTDELKVSTQQLASVLSNNQMRGEWGERIIEELMRANGLVEGVHYLKQQAQTTGVLRPDITLLLPDKRIVPVDVKFPYAAMQKVAMAESKAEKSMLMKQFLQDIKIKVNKVAEYINPSENTLDYAIMFVPNELIFSYINQNLPEVVDLAFRQRVLMVSPFTFMIVARTMLESYRNFMLSDKLREVIKSVDEFTSEWGKFKEKFTKYGRSLDTLKADYDEISGTRVRQMERRIDKIGQLQSGKEELLIETPNPLL